MDRSIIRNAGLSVVLCAGLGFGGLAMAQNAFAAETEDEAAATETEAKADEKEATEDKAADEKNAAEETESKDAEADEKDADADDAKAEAGALADGTYEGTGKGIGGDVPVTVTVKDGAIESVEVGDNSETQGIGSNAIEQLPEQFVGLKTAEEVDALDGVSGATITSNALKTAVADCLEQASAGDAEATDEADADKADEKDADAEDEKADEEKTDEKASSTDKADADEDAEADAEADEK